MPRIIRHEYDCPNVFAWEYVRDYLKEKGYSYRKFASKINVQPQRLSNWLRGMNQPSLCHVARIAKVMGCTVDELVNEEDE